MDCPVCNKSMKQEDFGGIEVHVCADGCKGIWFDCGELAKLDENNEGVGKALNDALAAPRVNHGVRGDLTCPVCQIPMHHHHYKSEKEVDIDECYKCGGIFIDAGELKVIRDHHMSEKEESDYLQGLLDNLPSYRDAERDLKAAEQREEALRRYTRFLRLSYYMTGR